MTESSDKNNDRLRVAADDGGGGRHYRAGLAGGVAGTAQAALPTAWGFVLVQTPSGAAVAVPAANGQPGKLGEEIVRVSWYRHQGGGARDCGNRSVRLVPGAEMGPSGGTETVVVLCYPTGGVPAFVAFTVMFSASSGAGLLYAYVHDMNAAAASHHPAGGASTVTVPGPGE
jgi:hypothetical protein